MKWQNTRRSPAAARTSRGDVSGIGEAFATDKKAAAAKHPTPRRRRALESENMAGISANWKLVDSMRLAGVCDGVK